MKDNKAKEGENGYLTNLATLKSHHFWPVDSKVPSYYELTPCYLLMCKNAGQGNLNLYDLELLQGWKQINLGK